MLSTGPENTGSWPLRLWRQWIEALRAEAAVLAALLTAATVFADAGYPYQRARTLVFAMNASPMAPLPA